MSLFAELRKYVVAGTWATQYLASLPEKIRESMLANVGTVVTFALSGEDAQALS